MAKELMEIGGFITSGAEIVNHDNSLSGNGTVDSPLGVASDYIVVTEETVGTYTITNTGDTNVNGVFSKTGYRPIAWCLKFGYAGSINCNSEQTSIENNELHFQSYARFINTNNRSITFKLLITWVKV